MDESTTLADLLSLNLHEFEDEVRGIVDKGREGNEHGEGAERAGRNLVHHGVRAPAAPQDRHHYDQD